MSDIANELGISKRTLYEVFHDKEELLEECFNTHMSKIEHEIEKITNNSENVIDALMLIYSRHLCSTQEVKKSVLSDLKKHYALVYKKIEFRQKSGYHVFISLMQKGIQQGLIRKDINFEVILWLLRAQFKALIEDEYIPTDKYSTNEFINAIILNFIRGISTPSGNERIDGYITREIKTKEQLTGHYN